MKKILYLGNTLNQGTARGKVLITCGGIGICCLYMENLSLAIFIYFDT